MKTKKRKIRLKFSFADILMIAFLSEIVVFIALLFGLIWIDEPQIRAIMGKIAWTDALVLILTIIGLKIKD